MAFVPLADSGVSYVLDGSSDVELVGSTVLTTVDGVAFDPDWSIVLGDGSVDYSIRITPLPYTSIGQGFGEGPSRFRFTRVDTTIADVVNGDEGETADEFIPNPVTGTGRKIDYIPGTGTETSRNESWQMLVEIEEVAPPTVLGPIRPILQTFRGYRSSDSVLTTWARTDEGRADLSSSDVRVRIYAYDHNTMLAEIEADASTLGRVDFAIPAATAQRQLHYSLYRLELVVVTAGVSQVVQVGLLELV